MLWRDAKNPDFVSELKVLKTTAIAKDVWEEKAVRDQRLLISLN